MVNFQDEIRYENNIIYTKDFAGEPDPRGLGCVYFDHMTKNKDLLAQIDGSTKEEDTFGTLLTKCVRTAIWLMEIGVKYGDVISLCSNSELNSSVAHISAFFVGAKIAAIDPSFSLGESVHLLRQVMPKVVFTGLESVGLIENVIKEIGSDTRIVVLGPSDKHVAFSDVIQPKPNESSFQPIKVRDLKDVALILFSSGTTGLPKGICHSHYAMLKAAETTRGQDFRNQLIYSNFPPYWNVFIIFLHQSIFNKSVRLMTPPFDFNNPWSIFSYKATTVMIDITRMLSLCHTPRPKNVDLSSVSSIMVSGTSISEAQMTKLRETFPDVLVSQNYGQSEVFIGMLSFDLSNPKHVELLHTKKGSCGRPMWGICYKVVDPDTEKVLGPNQIGELLVKTERQLTGYHNLDSSYLWDSEGWLKTGDYGYYDQDFCFYMIDRLKEMFSYRAKHITPALIENVINTHPSVFRATVIGIPNYIDNHHPMALIIVKPGSSNVTAGEIQKYVEERLEDPFHLRGGVKFVKSFPLTANGKVNRLKLKEMVRDNLI